MPEATDRMASSSDEMRRIIEHMKHIAIILTGLSAVALTAGCNQEPTTTEQLDKAKSEAKEAAHDMKDYAFAQKAEFVRKMESQLNALNQDLDKLSAKIDTSTDAVKAEAKPKLQALRDQASQLNKQLEDAKNSTQSTWDTVKANAEKAFDALTNGVHQARQWLSEKIAP
jgi:chromosome segregation ATPase